MFHFVNVVDDICMEITNVIRGQDHLTNTNKHIELFKAFDAPLPQFAHIPLILKTDGHGKMSKRDRGALIEEYQAKNFLPEAVRNYLCMLGWNPKNDKEIMEDQTRRLDRLYDYNMTRPTEGAKREALLKEMLAEVGEGCYIESPFHANLGGGHVHLGKYVYANFNLTMVDDTHIYVGDYTMIGPNVTVATAGHPILPELREKLYQYNMPVRIGRNCWIGAGAVILPGVTIGDNSVIGAGSVVTKDIPENVVAVGNPCRVLRKIDEHDREYYYKDRKIPYDEIL